MVRMVQHLALSVYSVRGLLLLFFYVQVLHVLQLFLIGIINKPWFISAVVGSSALVPV